MVYACFPFLKVGSAIVAIIYFFRIKARDINYLRALCTDNIFFRHTFLCALLSTQIFEEWLVLQIGLQLKKVVVSWLWMVLNGSKKPYDGYRSPLCESQLLYTYIHIFT